MGERSPAVFKKDFVVLILILAGALLIRLYDLDLTPLNLDEALDTIDGIERIKAGEAESFLAIPISTHHGKIPVLFNMFALIVSRFSVNPILVARLPAVFLGTLTILLIYVFARKLYNTQTALLAALFLAVFPWHVIMSRVGLKIILVPLSGIIIFYLLYTGIRGKKPALFLLSFFCLGAGSFYTYPSAVIFVPVFIISFFVLREKQDWPTSGIACIGVLLFLLSICPLIVLSAKGVNFLEAQSYHSFFKDDNLNMLSFYSVFRNFTLNMLRCFHLLFFHSSPISLYAPSMRYPLFLSNLFLPVFLLSLIYACWKRTRGDLVMLIWLILSFVLTSFIMGDGIDARYLFIISPVLIVLTARFLADIAVCSINFRIFSRIAAVAVSLLIVGCSSNVLVSYFKEAPDSKEEWIASDFGSAEAAKYLFEDNTSPNYKVIAGSEAPCRAWLQYYINILNKKKHIFGSVNRHFVKRRVIRQYITREDLLNSERRWLEESDVIYYFLWNFGTPVPAGDWWRREFLGFTEIFKEAHPGAKPVKKIYYPDGDVALEVFKVYRGRPSAVTQ